MNVLLKSVFLGIKHASPIMIGQKSGSIISTASVCGLMPGVGAHIYSVAKAGVIMMTKTAALELAEHDIRVNCVCPGYIATPLLAGAPLALGVERSEEKIDRAHERNRDSQPRRRVGEGDDVAQMVLFLASDSSSWMTGTAQVIDGGVTLGTAMAKAGADDHRGAPDPHLQPRNSGIEPASRSANCTTMFSWRHRSAFGRQQMTCATSLCSSRAV